MNLDRRLEKLEAEAGGTENLPTIERTIVSNKEQADHPERFKRVLDKVEETESGATVKLFHYERK